MDGVFLNMFLDNSIKLLVKNTLFTLLQRDTYIHNKIYKKKLRNTILQKIIQVKQKCLSSEDNLPIYPQRVAPVGVQKTLEMVRVVVKEVEVEMEVVVIQ